jgi:hypothetical protein
VPDGLVAMPGDFWTRVHGRCALEAFVLEAQGENSSCCDAGRNVRDSWMSISHRTGLEALPGKHREGELGRGERCFQVILG